MAEVLHLVRVTIEALSPISSASGESDLYDMALVRDANGLPEIAGSSLQGVLRHLYKSRRKNSEAEGETETEHLFGFARSDNTGRAGRLIFSCAKVHDSRDVAVVGLLDDAPAFEKDELLRMLAAEAPVQRDYVALNDRGVAAGRAKFERVAVPKGTRFSFEISMWGREDEAEEDRRTATELLALLRDPAFRIGGAARRGYGQIELKAAGYRRFALSELEALRDARKLPASDRTGFEDITDLLSSARAGQATSIRLTLTPVGLWRVGSTGTPLRTDAHELRTEGLIDGLRKGPDLREKDVDAASVREPRIEWSDGKGEWRQPTTPVRDGRERPAAAQEKKATFVIAGTAIKGALVHRTLFHWNRLSGERGEARMFDPAMWENEPDEGRRKEIIKGARREASAQRRRPEGRASLEHPAAEARRTLWEHQREGGG